MVELLQNTGGSGWGGIYDKVEYTFMNGISLTQTGQAASTWSLKFDSYYVELPQQNPHLENDRNWHGTLTLTGTDFTSDSTDEFIMGILFKEPGDNFWDAIKVGWTFSTGTAASTAFTVEDAYSYEQG